MIARKEKKLFHQINWLNTLSTVTIHKKYFSGTQTPTSGLLRKSTPLNVRFHGPPDVRKDTPRPYPRSCLGGRRRGGRNAVGNFRFEYLRGFGPGRGDEDLSDEVLEGTKKDGDEWWLPSAGDSSPGRCSRRTEFFISWISGLWCKRRDPFRGGCWGGSQISLR